MKRTKTADDKVVDRRSKRLKLSQFANTRSKSKLTHGEEPVKNQEIDTVENDIPSAPEPEILPMSEIKIISKPKNDVSPVSRPPESSKIHERILYLENQLGKELNSMNFGKSIQYIYNPIQYAYETHAMYVRKYANRPKKILFLGMNPGPWGMSQTGVPFGEINMTRDWLGISGPVGKPEKEHPDRLVTGFECTRSEVSGKRLWGLFKQLCGSAENFFDMSYVHNYCPIALMDGHGKNITPQDLKNDQMTILYSKCNDVLAQIIRLLETEIVVGFGRFAEAKAKVVVKEYNLAAKVLFLKHPSPRAVGNTKWDEIATKQLEELDLLQYFVKNPTSS